MRGFQNVLAPKTTHLLDLFFSADFSKCPGNVNSAAKIQQSGDAEEASRFPVSFTNCSRLPHRCCVRAWQDEQEPAGPPPSLWSVCRSRAHSVVSLWENTDARLCHSFSHKENGMSSVVVCLKK